MNHFILINFKNYPQSVGEMAIKLATEISKVKSKKYQLAVAPSFLTLKEIAKLKLRVYSQHADDVKIGAHTGKITPFEIKKVGAYGTILNHSEHKLNFNALKETVKLCRMEKLKLVICASSLTEIKNILKLKPDYIAYEPKELIGGNLSVTEAHPKIILEAVQLCKKISPATKLLCGAGIHSKEDLQQALKLGAQGVLLAHSVVKAKNPKIFLKEFLY